MRKPTAVIRAAHAKASAVRDRAYAPYSKFKVGAALIAENGEVVEGCNIENASYGGTVCAERVAILKAVSAGQTSFSDIVVVTDVPKPAFPCALCLQVMAEFFAPNTRIWIADIERIHKSYKFKELLPKPFGPSELLGSKVTRRRRP